MVQVGLYIKTGIAVTDRWGGTPGNWERRPTERYGEDTQKLLDCGQQLLETAIFSWPAVANSQRLSGMYFFCTFMLQFDIKLRYSDHNLPA